MADKSELQHIPRAVDALVLLEARSSLIARARKDAADVMRTAPSSGLTVAAASDLRATITDQGDGVEQFLVGELYYYKPDYEQAASWFGKAAVQGYAKAQIYLAMMYEKGQGGLQDYAMAAYWLQKAAGQGHAEAQYYLGTAYYLGRGVQRDYAQAALWLRKAADHNDADAQYYLGVCYYRGEGVQQDYAESCFWLDLAVLGRTEGAKQEHFVNYRNKAASRLTSGELFRVQGRVDKWLAEHPAKH